MADRRMFNKTIIDSDAFLDMPLSTQALYFHYSMRADDDGFVNNPSRITRVINATKNDYDLLVVKGFIIPFESGICVIKHWRIHNYLRNDRYKNTVYQAEKATLGIAKNNEYIVKKSWQKSVTDTTCIPAYNQTDTVGIPNDNQRDTQYRLGKDRLDKESTESECNTPARMPIFDTLESLSSEVRTVLKSWGVYAGVNEGAELTALVNLIASKVGEFGDKAIVDLINDMMSSGYRKIFWDRLDKAKASAVPATSQNDSNTGAYDFSAFELGGSD